MYIPGNLFRDAIMSLVLGIDVGTFKIAAVLLSREDRKLRGVATEEMWADLPPRQEGFFEQDSSKMLSAVHKAIAKLDPKLRAQVTAIGFTGQMHGVVLWNSKSDEVSDLINWQDQRCNYDGFLTRLQEKCDDYQIRSGYGFPTLVWLMENMPEYLSRFDRATTMHDYVACQACGITTGITDPTNAHSWGFYDIVDGKWEQEKIEKAGVPENFVPKVVPCGSVISGLSDQYADLWNLPAGIPVLAPIGDNQASLYSTFIAADDEIALTIGTAAQLSVTLSDITALVPTMHKGMEIRPYVNNQYVAVAAPLCGGQAFTWLVDTIKNWTNTLGIPCPERDELFKRLDLLGLEHMETPLEVCTSFLGERHNLNIRGSINGIDLRNFNLGNLFSGITKGTVQNLKDMLPEEVFIGKSRVVGSGNGLRKLRLAQAWVEEIFHMPLMLKQATEEAAQGAALLAIDNT